MPAPLKNPRHEAFAQYLYEGLTAENAYERAGYKPNRHNAAALGREQHILTRVADLQERKSKQSDVTVERLTEMLIASHAKAVDEGDITNQRQCAMDLAKLHGLIIDRSKNENENIVRTVGREPLSESEWRERHCKPPANKS